MIAKFCMVHEFDTCSTACCTAGLGLWQQEDDGTQFAAVLDEVQVTLVACDALCNICCVTAGLDSTVGCSWLCADKPSVP